MTALSRLARALPALLSLWMAVACAPKDSGVDVKFGRVGILWEGSQPHQALIEETTLVSRDVDGETALGFAVYPSSDEPYEVYSIHHLPELPADLGSSDTLTLTGDGRIRTDTEKAHGPRVFSFGFDEGDPVGTYKIDVYVNDRLVGSASIDVVEPAAK